MYKKKWKKEEKICDPPDLAQTIELKLCNRDLRQTIK